MSTIDTLIQKARTGTDENLIFSAMAMDGSTTEAGRMVSAACIEVLIERHPELTAVLDAWEMDMETELSMADVIALELA